MIRIIKYTGIVMLALTVLIVLTTCRASKIEKASTTLTENTLQEMNSFSVIESNVYSDIRTIIEKALSESLDFSKQETEYDSDKPVLPETGKPPIKKETQTIVMQKAEDKTHYTETNYTIRNDTKDSVSHSTLNTSIDSKSDTLSEANMQKESDIFLKWVGGITIILVVLILILCILGKFLKKRLQNFL